MGIPFTRDPNYIPSTWFLTMFPSHETLTIYPQRGSSLCSLTIYSPTETPNPRPQLYTLIQVPYYGSLLSVYIGIEKWVINCEMSDSLHTRPLLYTLNLLPYCVSFTRDPYYIPSTRHPQPETLTIYPQRGSLL